MTMANPEHLDILKQGVEVWNEWREENPEIIIDLKGAKLSRTDLSGINFSKAQLRVAYLRASDLTNSNLTEADLKGAYLNRANLNRADFTKATLRGANLSECNLIQTNFNSARLYFTNFTESSFESTNFLRSKLYKTVFGLCNLSGCIGLESVRVKGSCIIDFQTLQESRNLSKSFLLKVGLPELYINSFPQFGKRKQDFFPVFLSHSKINKQFAEKLYEALIDKGIQVWFDDKKLIPGDLLIGGISKGINLYDKMILVCSEASLNSWWVKEELERILEKERSYQKRTSKSGSLLIPITIDDYIYSVNNEYSVTILKHKVGDFREWQNEASFRRALVKLITALNVDREDWNPNSFL